MKVGINSYTYPWNVRGGMTAEQLLEQAIGHRASVLQLCDNLNLGALDWDGLSAKAEDHGIELQVGNIGGPDDLIAAAKIAERIGSPIVRFVIGPAFATQSALEVADDFREAAKICREHGTRMALENHDFFSTIQLRDIILAIGHDVGVCLDTANSISNLEGTGALVHHLAPHAICLHAKDVVVEREIHMLGFRVFGVPAGQGQVDFPLLKREMPNLESVILEQWPPTRNGQPPLDLEMMNVGSSLEYLRGVWAN